MATLYGRIPGAARALAVAILLTLGLGATSAHAQWREATSEHFAIVSESPERELIQTVQRLEAVHLLLTLATNSRGTQNGQRVRLYMLHNPTAVREAAGVDNDSQMIAVYFGNSYLPVALAARNRPPSDLYHEYAHHFMREYMPGRFPHWFIEGFAETVSTASFEIDGHITYGKVQNERRNELRYGGWLSTPLLFAERGDGAEEEGRGGRSHAGIATYGQYWVMTHYLLFAPERRGQLRQYISAISRGEDSPSAAAAAFGDLDQLDADIRAYLRRADFMYRPVPLPQEVMQPPAVRTLRAGEVAALRLEMEAGRTWGEEANTALLPRVAQLVTEHPQEPAAHALHAWVLLAAEKFQEAADAADRAIAIEPAHARSNALRALAQYRLSAEEGVVEAGTLAQISQFAETARSSDPREPALAMLPRLSDRTAAMTRGSSGAAEGARPQRGRIHISLVLSREQSQAFSEAFERLDDDPAGARTAFEALATRFPDTRLAAYALRIAAWIDGGMEGDFPQTEAHGD